MGRESLICYKLILFYSVFIELQVAFYSFKKFKLVFETWPVKVGLHNKLLVKGKTKTA